VTTGKPAGHDYEGVATQVRKQEVEDFVVKPVAAGNKTEDMGRYPLELYQVVLEMEQLVAENEHLIKERQKLSELLANILHELRAPLASIKGFTTALLQTDVKWDKKTQRDFLQTIDQETDRVNRLIGDLLDMSRLEAGALKLDKDSYQISEILDSVSRRLITLTEHHELRTVVPDGLPLVFVDEMRIGQVLTNLVENSIKYSRAGSPITIEAQRDGNQVIVSVTDQGEGITAEFLPKVFDRFYQVKGVVSGRKKGVGLGLSICRGIVEAHGGEIWAESWVGEGSRFSFSLPVKL
jgi:two-component system sensor histidine kinase KdpD